MPSAEFHPARTCPDRMEQYAYRYETDVYECKDNVYKCKTDAYGHKADIYEHKADVYEHKADVYKHVRINRILSVPFSISAKEKETQRCEFGDKKPAELKNRLFSPS